MLGLISVEPLEDDGLGRIGYAAGDITLGELAKTVEEELCIKVRFCGDIKSPVKKVAVCSGAGCDVIPTAISKGADVLITGDTKYHQMLDVIEDINVIDAGHFGTEAVVVELFAEILCDMGLQVFWQNTEDVYKYL